MKIGGKRIDSKPASDFIVFPREGDDIAIRANAVMDRADFDRLAPIPKPPKKRVKGGNLVDDTDSPKYQLALNQHSTKFINWLTLTSLCGVNRETQEDMPIEWEKVDLSNPSTWHMWEDELKENGFSDMERKRIANLVLKVNSLTEDRLDEARQSFLQPKEAEAEPSSSLTIEQADTPSGEHANGLVSALQESQEAGTTSTQ